MDEFDHALAARKLARQAAMSPHDMTAIRSQALEAAVRTVKQTEYPDRVTDAAERFVDFLIGHES